MIDFKMDSLVARAAFKSVFTIAIAAPLFIAGCNYKTAKTSDGGGTSPDALAAGTQPTFAQLSAQTLAAKCFVCHNGNVQNDLSTYAHFQADLKDIRARILSSGSDHMPRSGSPQLTTAETSSIISWIDSGAPENGQSASAAPSTPAAPAPSGPVIPVPSFAELKANIVDPKCVSCHAHASGGRHDLSDYAHFKTLASKVETRVLLPIDKKGHMPEADHAQLTNEELTTLVAWIAQGAPEKGIGETAPVAAPTPVAPVPTPVQSATPAPVPTATPSPTPVAGPITLPQVMGFDQLNTSILTPKCITCHDGTGDPEDLRTFAAANHLAASIKSHVLAPATSNRHMPPKDHAQLTDAEIADIVAWVDAGAPLDPPTPASPKQN